jgi:hypothetical protein
LLPWLWRIARARACDFLRRLTTRTQAMRTAYYTWRSALPRWHPGALHAAERHEVRDLLRQGIGGLPGQQRLVFGAYVDHYPESVHLAALRRLVALSSCRILTPAALKRALEEGQAKMRSLLRQKGYAPGE